MLIAAHTQDVTNAWGDRFGDGEGSEDRQDLSPDTLWRLLKLHIGQKGVPLVLDVDSGAEVWNYPVYSYRIEYEPSGAAGHYVGQMTLLMADSVVPLSFVGTQERRLTYQFSFQMRNGSVVVGSAKWIGRNEQDHPDFAWYPFIARSENPEIHYAVVQKMTGGTARVPQSDSSPELPPATPATPATPAETPLATVTPTTPAPTPAPMPMPATTPAVATTQPAAQPATQPATSLPSASNPTLVSICPIELMSLLATETSSFGVDITVDRFDGGKYRVGETLSVTGSSERAGYLYLLQVDANGELTQLFPRIGEDNRIAAGRISVKQPLRFSTGEVFGMQRIKALVSQRPLNLSGLVAAEEGPSSFNWHTTQKQQMQTLLKSFQRQERIDPKQLGTIDVRRLTGAFGQDCVTFYVGPGSAKTGSSVAVPQSRIRLAPTVTRRAD